MACTGSRRVRFRLNPVAVCTWSSCVVWCGGWVSVLDRQEVADVVDDRMMDVVIACGDNDGLATGNSILMSVL